MGLYYKMNPSQSKQHLPTVQLYNYTKLPSEPIVSTQLRLHLSKHGVSLRLNHVYIQGG
jgi:hypothetical protein